MLKSVALTAAQCLRGTLRVPGDKSISHRALMLGALAEGLTQIEGILPGDDPRSTAECFRQLGAQISTIDGARVEVHGVGLGNLRESTDILYTGNSGTTTRLMLGILSAQPGLFSCLNGDASIRTRPMGRVIEPLSRMGAQIWGRDGAKRAPLAVLGQHLRPIHYDSPVASAQVKSAILLAGLLTVGETSVREPVRSRDHSERMLTAFGADIRYCPDTTTVTLRGPARLSAQQIIVPGDISSAAFWLVAAAIVPGAELLLNGVGINPTRTGVLEVLGRMGADIQIENERTTCGEPVADLRVRSSRLEACEIGGEVIPRLIDELPILAVAACCARGKTVIRDAAELRVKESDRIAVMARELNRLGARVEELPDGLIIEGGHPLIGAEVESHSDHRVAMSLAIAALVTRGTTVLGDPECATVSYPGFFKELARLKLGP